MPFLLVYLTISYFFLTETFAQQSTAIFCENISFKIGAVIRTKEVCCAGKKPGIMRNSNPGPLFIPLQSKLKLALEAKNRHQIRKLKAFLRAGREYCRLANSILPTPTPVETATPSTPAPTATSTPLPNIDSQGNVTAKGKECFEIPPELSANTEIGEAFVTQNCVNCHGTNLLDIEGATLYDRPFPFVRTRIAVSPMSFDSQDIPDEDLANVVAYLNRFRAVNCQ